VKWVESNSPIRFSHTLLERNEKIVTELVEESEPVGEGTGERLLEIFPVLAKDCTTVIISGSKAAGFKDNLIPEMVRMTAAQGCGIILDIRGKDLVDSLPYIGSFKSSGSVVIKPNLYEFASTFAPELVSKNNVDSGNPEVKNKIAKIWAGLYEKYKCRLVLTRGSDPVWYAEDAEIKEYAFESVEPLNTTGSGDAFTAGLAAALGDGSSLRDAVALGARCGALNAQLLRPGVIK